MNDATTIEEAVSPADVNVVTMRPSRAISSMYRL